MGNLIATLQDIIFHNRFRTCETTYTRSTNHLFLVFGFIFLAIVTTWGFLNEWVLHVESPYFLFSPIKLLAMAGTAALLYGIWNIIKERQANAAKAGYGSYYDWFLIYVIFAVGATGLLRLAVPPGGHPDSGLPHVLPAPDRHLHAVLLCPVHQDGPHGLPYRGHAPRPHVGPGLLTAAADT